MATPPPALSFLTTLNPFSYTLSASSSQVSDSIMISMFWLLCSNSGNLLFRVRVRLAASPQLPAHAGSSLAYCTTLKMEATRSSDTSVQSTTSTRRHTPKYGNFQRSHRRENLKSYILLFRLLQFR
jgi:hypothetical protein